MKQVKSTRTWLMVLSVLTIIGLLLKIYSYVAQLANKVNYDELKITGPEGDYIAKVAELGTSPIMQGFSIVAIIIGIVAIVLLIKNYISLGQMIVPTLTGIIIYFVYQLIDVCATIYSVGQVKNIMLQTLGEAPTMLLVGTAVGGLLPTIIMIILAIVAFVKLSNLNQQELDAQEISDL